MSTEPETQGIDKKGIINQDQIRTQDTKTINLLSLKSGITQQVSSGLHAARKHLVKSRLLISSASVHD